MGQPDTATVPPSPNCDLGIRYDVEMDEYHLNHDWTGSMSVGSRIVLALERITGSETHELEPLQNTIDPESLDKLFRPLPDGTPRGDGLVTFTFVDHVITVSSSGRIDLSPVHSQARE